MFSNQKFSEGVKNPMIGKTLKVIRNGNSEYIFCTKLLDIHIIKFEKC